jgi:hypothetical protein
LTARSPDASAGAIATSARKMTSIAVRRPG